MTHVPEGFQPHTRKSGSIAPWEPTSHRPHHQRPRPGVAVGFFPFFTRPAGKAQSGYVFTYAFAMVIGIAVLVTWMTMTGGAN